MNTLSITEAGHLAWRLCLAGRTGPARDLCRRILESRPADAQARDLLFLMDAPVADLLAGAEASGDPTRARARRCWSDCDQTLKRLAEGWWVSYSANHEDVMLNRLFAGQSGGFYVDAGANDPLADSVTLHFYLNGWRGINLEPSEHVFQTLAAFRRRDVNLGVALGERRETRTFYDIQGSGQSTLSEEFGEGYRKLIDIPGRPVEVRTLADVCAEHAPARIDFLKVDVEGWEGPVLRGNDWTRFRPVALVIEATRPLTHIPTWQEWEPALLRHDYLFAWFDGYNRFYVRAEDRELLRHFEYPPCPSDRFLHHDQVRRLHEARLLALKVMAAGRGAGTEAAGRGATRGGEAGSQQSLDGRPHPGPNHPANARSLEAP